MLHVKVHHIACDSLFFGGSSRETVLCFTPALVEFVRQVQEDALYASGTDMKSILNYSGAIRKN